MYHQALMLPGCWEYIPMSIGFRGRHFINWVTSLDHNALFCVTLGCSGSTADQTGFLCENGIISRGDKHWTAWWRSVLSDVNRHSWSTEDGREQEGGRCLIEQGFCFHLAIRPLDLDWSIYYWFSNSQVLKSTSTWTCNVTGLFSSTTMDDDICLRGALWGVLTNIEPVYSLRRHKVIRWKRIEPHSRVTHHLSEGTFSWKRKNATQCVWGHMNVHKTSREYYDCAPVCLFVF